VNTTELRDLADRLSGVDPAEIQAVLRTAASVYDNLSAIADKWNLECDELREDNKRLSAERDELRTALKNLLEDTQHAEHEDCDEGPCPVREARELLKGQP